MSVTLNPAALEFLLQNPAGPVGLDLYRRANVVTGNYQAVINGIWENQEGSLKPEADFVIESGEAGLQAVIGIRFDGRISEYMGIKMETEADRVVPAIMSGVDG